jgi:hypothetical protein
VLTSNPFANLSKAITILSLVSGMIFIFLLGVFYMLRWDALDHNKLFYLGKTKMQERNKKYYDMPIISEHPTTVSILKNDDFKVDHAHVKYSSRKRTTFEESKFPLESLDSSPDIYPDADDYDSQSSYRSKLTKFVNSVIPESLLLVRYSMLRTYWLSLMKYHSFIIFCRSNPSSLTRTMNYLNLW